MYFAGKWSEWCKRRKVELMVHCVRKQSEWCTVWEGGVNGVLCRKVE